MSLSIPVALQKPVPRAVLRLEDTPFPSIEEAIVRAGKLVSPRTGMIKEVRFEKLPPGLPEAHWVISRPANVETLTGKRALNDGSATSVDRGRAIMKAVGESIERYCSAIYDENSMLVAGYEELEGDAVDPRSFVMFSEAQYEEPGFPHPRPDKGTPIRWVPGYSLRDDRSLYMPAAMVYVPYEHGTQQEVALWNRISTGLGCAHNLATAVYKGLLEVVERDAFMIMWRNRLSLPRLDLRSVDDPFARRLLDALSWVPARLEAIVLTLDIAVPVIMIVLTSTSGVLPHTIVAAGADLDPRRALVLALEEACLTYSAMERYASSQPSYHPQPDFSDVTSPYQHAIAHTMAPELRPTVEFMTASTRLLRLDEMPDVSSDSNMENLHIVVRQLAEKGLDVLAVDLTTEDISEVGFKVARAVVPGMQPLDINHKRQFKGGSRLYEVPYGLGLLSEPNTEQMLNPDLHPFP